MNSPSPNDPPSRRNFFELTLGWLAATFAVAASSVAAVKFLTPNVLYEPSLRFKAGRPDDYADGSVTFLEDERVFIVRRGGTFQCVSAICTHLGCTVNRTLQGYHCPCHGSVFNNQGQVLGGPAPRSLEWFLMTLSKDNRLLVDKTERVAADKYLVL
ncbi:MAG TPA: Rieske 2Fe-2S domain-containing protein [Opitutaceae bacterium]|jgi:cytochrome b6-f complex iron-sulfur subunit|nr:Rieske 2Fe-2S domain-containing protein [Opitutaceae bacterium]